MQLMCEEGCSYTYPPLSIARYSFIQLSELEQCRVKNLLKVLTPEHRIQTRVLLFESPKLHPWATALYITVMHGWTTHKFFHANFKNDVFNCGCISMKSCVVMQTRAFYYLLCFGPFPQVSAPIGHRQWVNYTHPLHGQLNISYVGSWSRFIAHRLYVARYLNRVRREFYLGYLEGFSVPVLMWSRLSDHVSCARMTELMNVAGMQCM